MPNRRAAAPRKATPRRPTARRARPRATRQATPKARRRPRRRATAALSARSRKSSERLEILAERFGEVGPLQREVDQRFQISKLVAGIVPHAIDLVDVERP